jgi:UDP-N-acetylmuramoyl-L-alanyl-D-glutamate--2,6-diaminopimelate ligase
MTDQISSSAGDLANRPLHELLRQTSIPRPDTGAEATVNAIVTDSRAVVPGALFVAIAGSSADGHDHLEEVVARGAAALVVERDPGAVPKVPLIRVENTRRALAELAAAWYGRPADRLRMVGITGTIGKTSVLKMLEAIVLASGRRIGTIGSLGVSVGREEHATGYTAPDPLLLHQGLATIAESGCTLAAMEVTSHALDQERVHGLWYDLGIFTNLVPLEHADYHGSFKGYVEVKRRFLDHLRPGVPVVHSADDRGVRRLVRDADVLPVSCGSARSAMVRIEEVRMDDRGTSLLLNVRKPVPKMEGGSVAPMRLELRLQLLGRGNVVNAALAASAALSLGVEPSSIREAIAVFPPPRRRMEVVQREPFLLIDDSIGHPDSVSALFDGIERLNRRRVHAVFAVRGMRGARINARTAEALATWLERTPVATLVVTHSSDRADERNRVRPRERDAFVAPLRAAGIPFSEEPRLADAVAAVLERAEAGDLVLLLGAQGMDSGRDIAEEWLREHQDATVR